MNRISLAKDTDIEDNRVMFHSKYHYKEHMNKRIIFQQKMHCFWNALDFSPQTPVRLYSIKILDAYLYRAKYLSAGDGDKWPENKFVEILCLNGVQR